MPNNGSKPKIVRNAPPCIRCGGRMAEIGRPALRRGPEDYRISRKRKCTTLGCGREITTVECTMSENNKTLMAGIMHRSLHKLIREVMRQ